MGFGWAGAGAGAAKSLESILAEQMLQAKLAQQQAEDARRLQLEETRLNETLRQNDLDEKFRVRQEERTDATLRQNDLDEKFRVRQEERTDATRRQKDNQTGTRRMVGEFLMQRGGALTPEDRRSIAALQVEAGDMPDLSLLTEPKEPRQGPQPDYEWITRNGTPMQIRKGTAQPGDRPYEKAAATTNVPSPEKAAETRAKILDAAKGLRDSKGVKSMTGARGMSYGFGLSGDTPVPGTNAASAKARFDTLKSLMTLENLGLLKGAMSDKDLAFIQSAGSAINTAMDDNTFAAELDKIIRTFESPSAAAPAPSGVPTLVFNPATGKLEPVKR